MHVWKKLNYLMNERVLCHVGLKWYERIIIIW